MRGPRLISATRYQSPQIVLGSTSVTTVLDDSVTCAILADHHAAVTDRLRELLCSAFGTVFTVADAQSLQEGVRRLAPGLVVVDLGFGEHGTLQLLRQVKSDVPQVRTIALSLYDDPAVGQAALAAGADGVVLKRAIGDDLLEAVDAVLSGKTYVSACFEAEQTGASPNS